MITHQVSSKNKEAKTCDSISKVLNLIDPNHEKVTHYAPNGVYKRQSLTLLMLKIRHEPVGIKWLEAQGQG